MNEYRVVVRSCVSIVTNTPQASVADAATDCARECPVVAVSNIKATMDDRVADRRVDPVTHFIPYFPDGRLYEFPPRENTAMSPKIEFACERSCHTRGRSRAFTITSIS
jgi:hypothetical protein